jgi:tellurite resistance protein TerC
MNLVIHISPAEWVVFALIVLGMLALDLAVFNRKSHAVRLGEAIVWSAAWIAVALLFNAGVFLVHGREAGTLFFTAWLVEKALSVDNLFVFLAIFTFFKIELRHQHRVLFYGVLGALVMRAIFIAGGTALLHAFDWFLYVFGAILIYTGVRIGAHSGGPLDPGESRVVRFATNHLRLTPQLQGDRFLVRLSGAWLATPLFLVLVVIEFMDVLFAFDSVPAVLGISSSSFIVYTSNAFAVLGLRALYFVVAAGMARLRYLNVGLAAILVFIGAKMIVHRWIDLPTVVSLAVIAALLAGAIFFSLRPRAKDDPD